MKINKEKLFQLYMERVNEICEECDWIDTVSPEMIVGIIATILENDKTLMEDV